MHTDFAVNHSSKPLAAAPRARIWRRPTAQVIAMDAEIGSYQEDRDPTRDPDWCTVSSYRKEARAPLSR